MTRGSNGMFQKGHSESIEEKIKRVDACKDSWKIREDYISDIKSKHPYIYNVWRGFMFTQKGHKIGHQDSWNDFRTFYNDVVDGYSDGKRFRRIDRSMPFSINNYIWVEDKYRYLTLVDSMVAIEYNGKSQTIKEWAVELQVNVLGIKSRYYKHRNSYSIEEILIGKKSSKAKKITDISNLNDYQDIKDKASKMLSSYKLKDKKKGLEFDIKSDWFIENILKSKCVYCGDNQMLGCDRIDNLIGHTKENVVPCCYSCNVARNNNFSYSEMMLIGETIRQIKESRTKAVTIEVV